MSNESDREPSLIEYARFHGLADNHLNQDAYACFSSDLLPCPDHVELPEFTVPCVGKFALEPKFRLDSKAASLLASCIKSPPAPNLSSSLSDHRKVKKLKLEQPALKTDHENDMRKLRSRKLSKVEDCNIPVIGVEEDESEHLEWVREIMEVASSWDKTLAREKLQTTRQVFKSLQDTLRPVYTSEMHQAIIAKELAFNRRPKPVPMSPPLMPDDDDKDLYVPSSPALRMQLLSDGTYPDGESMRKVNEEISDQIRITTGDATPAAVDRIEKFLRLAECGPAIDRLNTLEADEQTPADRVQRPLSLKLETPELELWTPAKSRREYGAERLTLHSVLETTGPDHMKSEEAGSDDIDQPFKDGLLAQLAKEAAQAVDKDIAEEKLETTDIILRVDVPKLNDIGLTALDSDPRPSKHLQMMVYDHLKHTIQPFDERAERKMRWAPIPSGVSKTPTHETIEPPSQFSGWTSQPAFAIRSEHLLWRPDMLRVLSVGEEDEEEELREDLTLRDEPVQISQSPLKRPAVPDATDSFFKRPARRLAFSGAELCTSDFGSLAGFMDTRKAYKKPRLDPEAKPSEATRPRTICSADPKKEETGQVQIPAPPMERLPIDVATLGAPPIPKVTSPRSIILSTRLLKSHRQLTQHLETRPSPPLTIIYRELGHDNNANEGPDIILSPTTAITYTTLQATTQRSLPGQGSSRSPVFHRILLLSQLYDRLIVLTTLPPTTISSLESPIICSQITTLLSFCTSLSHPSSTPIVQAILIPTPTPLNPTIPTIHPKPPTPSPLYPWTYALILQHAPTPKPATTLLPSETLWELFLRHAGLNPYAAQAILGILKTPDQGADPAQPQRCEQPQQEDEEEEEEEEEDDARSAKGVKGGGGGAVWGLSAVVQMSRAERMRRFRGVVGTRAVERVSGVLDAGGWGGV